jgi:hypothetical protein
MVLQDTQKKAIEDLPNLWMVLYVRLVVLLDLDLHVVEVLLLKTGQSLVSNDVDWMLV